MKRSTLVLALCLCTITFSALAGESLFPVVGTSYRLIYATRPEGEFWPGEVKIVAKGDGQWVLVEFEHEVTQVVRRRIVSPESGASPEATKTPKTTPPTTPTIITQRKWINFALIVAAEQKG